MISADGLELIQSRMYQNALLFFFAVKYPLRVFTFCVCSKGVISGCPVHCQVDRVKDKTSFSSDRNQPVIGSVFVSEFSRCQSGDPLKLLHEIAFGGITAQNGDLSKRQ